MTHEQPDSAICPACGADLDPGQGEDGHRCAKCGWEERLEGVYVARLDRVEALVDVLSHRLDAVERRLDNVVGVPASASVSDSARFVSTLGAVTQIEPKPRAPISTTAPPEPAEPADDVVVVEDDSEVPVPDLLPGAEPEAEAEPEGERTARPPYVRPVPPAPAEVDWEKLISGRGLAWVGGLALLLGSVYFLSLAFNRGWISPGVRVVLGVAAGLLLTAGGARFYQRREALFGHVLTAVGLGMTSLSMVAATRLYDLVPIEIGLLGSLASAGLAAAIAIRFNTQVVAVFGLVTALVAPPLLGASPDATTIAFLGVGLIGSTAIALYRSWSWLPPLAFLLTAPQAAVWFDDASRPAGFTALAAFWLLHATAAGGEEFRIRRGTLRPSSVTVLLGAAAFGVWSGFVLLDEDSARWGGTFLLVVAVAHAALGLYFLRSEGDRHPFGLLAVGTGLTALTMAVPIQFGGSAVPIAWAAEATALAWLANRRSHRFSAIASGVLGALAIAHLFTIEYPLWQITDGLDGHRPFLTAEFWTLVFILSAMAAVCILVHRPIVRTLLTALGLSLLVVALPFELSDVALIGGWAVIAVAGLAARRLPALGFVDLPLISARWPNLDAAIRFAPEVVAAVAAGLALSHFTTIEISEKGLEAFEPVGTAFTDQATLAAAILVGAAALGAWVSPLVMARRAAIVGAVAVAALLVPYELREAGSVVAWSFLAVVLLGVEAKDPKGTSAYLTMGGVLVLFAARIAFEAAPLTRLAVDATSDIDHPLFWSGATAAFGALACALGLAAWRHRSEEWARYAAALAGASVVYLLSVGVVDEFQSQVGDGTDVSSLEKRAQVALSILWAALGGISFAAGVARRIRSARIFGLGLLGLATAKVFILDLASLDASYRVLSFIGLGLLLLGSSYLYQRVIAPTAINPEEEREEGDE